MRLSLKEQQYFLKQLSVFLHAGVALPESLRFLQMHSKGALRTVITHLAEGVNSGRSLAAGVSDYHRLFGRLVIGLLEVGETTGTLPDHLRIASEYVASKRSMNGKIISVLVYPIFVAFLSLAVALLLLLYVLPKLLPIFSSLDFQLPLATRILLALHSFTIHNWPLVLLVLVLIGAVGKVGLGLPKVKKHIDALSVRVPFVATYVVQYQTWQICRMLAVLLKAELPLVRAIQKVNACTAHSQYALMLTRVEARVVRGEALAQSFAEHPLLFPATVVQLLSMGEHTGTLSDAMQYAAANLETETSELAQKASTLFEPVLLIAVGLMVGFVAIATITPIYGITQSLQFR